jgi:CRISPR-associated protein Cmr6
MVNILDAANLVPLMFQAQAKGRSQLQYIDKEKEPQEQDSYKWASEWTKEAYLNPPEFGDEASTEIYQIQWRFVTNGGQFEGIIFPALGAFGLPFYPGSSMKGAFCQACTDDQKKLYRLTKNSDEPSLLRFHGGYPVNDWKQNLVDIVHPQQGWQVKTQETKKRPDNESAFALISLYEPTIKFGISSLLPETETNWNEIWAIWEKALTYGIGCRTSNGYGQPATISGEILYQVKLRGQGGASKLINKKAEFRPNIFRAALRGHALRIFGGLNQSMADNIVDELFGGIRKNKEKQGLLGMSFQLDGPSADVINYPPEIAEGKEADYTVSGTLIWKRVCDLYKHKRDSSRQSEREKIDPSEYEPTLKNLVQQLTEFAMLLGGFGKSWRRADHRLFYKKYTKHLIGCHWNWVEECDNHVHNLNRAGSLILEIQKTAKEWMEKRGVEVKPRPATPPPPLASAPEQDDPKKPKLKKRTDREDIWREAWRDDNVQVWGRIANNAQDSKVIPWLHPFQQSNKPQNKTGSYHQNQPNKSQTQSRPEAFQKAPNQNSRPVIYRKSLTGRVKDKNKSNDPTEIGRLWHRMYPLKDGKYLELITIFNKGCSEAEQLINWLNSPNCKSGFKKVWPIN